MKNIVKYIRNFVVVGVSVVALAAPGLTGIASAQVKYDPNGTPTTKTPVFNQFYDVPDGVGNEADFVRIKPQAGTNADYANSLNSACNVGDAYTVRTYIHNGADPSYNNNGAGSAVAHNVKVAMQAPLNSKFDTFMFNSVVTASNATKVADSATLNCNGKTVKLTLVPGSVQTYSKQLGFQGAPDSAVNGSLGISSHVAGSGDVWACWPERVIVTYTVKVTSVPQPAPSAGQCKAVSVTTDKNRTVKVNVDGSTTNAQIVGYKIDFGDGTVVDKQAATHQYAKDGTYKIVAQVQVKLANGQTVWKTAETCEKQVTFTSNKPPKVTPPPAHKLTPPTTLVNTGPGAMLGIFAAVTAASTVAYRWFIGRKLSQES